MVARGVAKECIVSAGGVVEARGVVKERIDSAGGVGVARGVAKEGLESAGGVGSMVMAMPAGYDSLRIAYQARVIDDLATRSDRETIERVRQRAGYELRGVARVDVCGALGA